MKKKVDVIKKRLKKKGAISAYEKSYSETCSISHLRFRHPVTSDKHKCMVPKYLFNTLCVKHQSIDNWHWKLIVNYLNISYFDVNCVFHVNIIFRHMTHLYNSFAGKLPRLQTVNLNNVSITFRLLVSLKFPNNTCFACLENMQQFFIRKKCKQIQCHVSVI
jgi:hypothetical protein